MEACRLSPWRSWVWWAIDSNYQYFKYFIAFVYVWYVLICFCWSRGPSVTQESAVLRPTWPWVKRCQKMSTVTKISRRGWVTSRTKHGTFLRWAHWLPPMLIHKTAHPRCHHQGTTEAFLPWTRRVETLLRWVGGIVVRWINQHVGSSRMWKASSQPSKAAKQHLYYNIRGVVLQM